MYKCLKQGWIPYNIALEKYNIKVDRGRYIEKIPENSKEKIGRMWFIKEKALNNLK